MPDATSDPLHGSVTQSIQALMAAARRGELEPVPLPIFWLPFDPHGPGNSGQYAERDLAWAKWEREEQKGRD